MSRERELVKNTMILGFGKMFPKFTTFITIPILTARLTKTEYGTYDLITTLIMLVLPIATLQIQSAAFRYLIDYRKNKKKSSSIVTNIFMVTIPITFIVSFIIQFFFRKLLTSVRILISFYFFFDTFYLTCAQTARGLGKNKEYSIAAAVVAVVNMTCVFFAVQVADRGLWGVMLALTIANGGGSIYLVWASKLYKYINLSQISVKQIKELLLYSWPMIPNNLSTWVLKLSDRLVITAFLGIEANAVYAVANKIPNILSMAQSVMVMAWHENASIAVKDDDADEYYSKMIDITFSLMYGLTVLLIAITPFIFWILIRGDYADAYYQIPILVMGMFFFVMSSYFGGIYIAHKKTINVGISTMFAALINLGIDLLFVNFIGIWAGSISTLISYAVLYFYRMINVQKIQKIQYNGKKQAFQIISMVVMLILCFMQQAALDGINIILGIVLFVIFNKNIVINLLGKLKNN